MSQAPTLAGPAPALTGPAPALAGPGPTRARGRLHGGRIPADTRGILDPAVMARYVTLNRYPAGPVLDGVVDWFWAVSWQLPPGFEHVQSVLNHPGANISIGTVDDHGATPQRPQGRVYGLQRRISERRLTGDGWTVAAKTTVGGFGALITGPARALTDARGELADVLGVDGDALVRQVTTLPTEHDRVERLRRALEEVVIGRDPRRVAQARELATAARRAEHDPAVTRPAYLADACRVGVRTLQRLFGEYVGTSPAWVIRRWRLIEAAERAKADPGGTDWAGVAAELGYSDQAHLVREFRAAVGTTPGAYAARQRG